MQLESVWVLLKPTLNMFFTVFDKLGMTTPLTPWPQEKQSQYWQQYIGHNSARAFYKLVKWWRWRTRAGCRCSSNTRRPDVWAREQTPVFSLVVVFVARWWVVQCKQGYSQSPLSDSGVVSMTGAPVARCYKFKRAAWQHIQVWAWSGDMGNIAQ